MFLTVDEIGFREEYSSGISGAQAQSKFHEIDTPVYNLSMHVKGPHLGAQDFSERKMQVLSKNDEMSIKLSRAASNICGKVKSRDVEGDFYAKAGYSDRQGRYGEVGVSVSFGGPDNKKTEAPSNGNKNSSNSNEKEKASDKKSSNDGKEI